ncbi:MAG: hypothetical protein KDD41_06540 [Flavobacteriales bacterium]|nr:hypothetical protein [Flavobacteriales bacterium]
MQNFTHFDLLEITKKENELKSLLDQESPENKGPKNETIQNILNYSKALSVRKSSHLDTIEMVLN